MRLEDRDDFVDTLAQAVIDRIEERSRITTLVDQVVARVIALQQQQATLQAEATHSSTTGTIVEGTADEAEHGIRRASGIVERVGTDGHGSGG